MPLIHIEREPPVAPEEEISILIFNVAGVRLGIDICQISEMLGIERVSEGELTVLSLPELIDFGSCTTSCEAPVVLMLRELPYGIVVDRPESIVPVGISSIHPLPPLLKRAVSPPAIWGVASINGELVLLINVLVLFDFETACSANESLRRD